MRKLNVILALMILALSSGASAWGFSFGGYRYEVGNTQVVDYLQDAPQAAETPQISTNQQEVASSSPIQDINTPRFVDEVRWLNSQGEVQMTLKDLDYRRIGIVNTDDGNQYTAFINEDGTIQAVKIGLYDPEATISGSLSEVRGAVERNDVMGILDNVNIPFKVKVKLLWMNLW